jgi:hypothetical protein
MIQIEFKTVKKITLILGLLISFNMSYADCTECNALYQNNYWALSGEYAYATAQECMPFVGDNAVDGMGLGDLAGYGTEIYGFMMGSAEVSGGGTIILGLDAASNFWDCVGELRGNYYEGLDIISDTLQECYDANGGC